MRVLGLVGDTQGRYRVPDLLQRLAEAFADVDEVWHAGDWQDYAVLEGLRALGRPFRVVNGNAPDDPAYPERLSEQVEGLRVGMTHRPPRPEDRWVREHDIVVHGHTHRWRDEVIDGVRFINVSTPTAAGFSQDRSAGILRIDGRQARLEKLSFGDAGGGG